VQADDGDREVLLGGRVGIGDRGARLPAAKPDADIVKPRSATTRSSANAIQASALLSTAM
jgi:hypothetical protein